MKGLMGFICLMDRMASLLAPYERAEALSGARDLDSKVETLLFIDCGMSGVGSLQRTYAADFFSGSCK
jgi:hypothetical protein